MSVRTYSRDYILPKALWARPHRASWFPASLYMIFGAADLFFSLIAFRFGIAEGNPFMAWLVAHDLFVPGKLIITLFVAGLMVIVYSATHRWRWTVWSGVVLTGCVVAFHVWALPRVAGLPALFSVF